LNPKQVIAYNLRKLRKDAGLSQEEIATRSGLHVTYISSVEHGKRNISVENIFAIAKALGCAPSALLATREEDDVK
jgi:transcriptional regulator with XRE-family HTH domain